MRCHVTDDATDSAGYPARSAASPSTAPADDLGPKPRSRGNFAGFLPDTLAADLRASVASGHGLALVQEPDPAGASCSPLVALAALAVMVSILR